MQRLVAVVAAAALISGWIAYAEPTEASTTSVFEDSRDGKSGGDANGPAPVGLYLDRAAVDAERGRCDATTEAHQRQTRPTYALRLAPKTSPPASS